MSKLKIVEWSSGQSERENFLIIGIEKDDEVRNAVLMVNNEVEPDELAKLFENAAEQIRSVFVEDKDTIGKLEEK